MADIELVIKQAGLKVTSARVKILELMMHAQPRHLSAEDLFKQLLDEGETLGLATVYRVLNQFAEAKILTRHNFEGGCAIYERAAEHHDHLICQRCGKIIEFDDPIINQRLKMIAEQSNTQIISKDLTLFGICSDCDH